MFRNIFLISLIVMLANSSFAKPTPTRATHCPYGNDEVEGWRYTLPLSISRDSLLYASFGVNKFDNHLFVTCLYRSGNWLSLALPEGYSAKPLSGNWIMTSVPADNYEKYRGYSCRYPDAPNCTWEISK